ncbi:MAG: DUF4118 domain-containing protein [Candidatus Limivivens sp.]|nr:DUF4118 domain-containing protein [Candidatus Limivivens sp.]
MHFYPLLTNAAVTAVLLPTATGLALLLFHFVQEDSPSIAMLYLLALVLIARYTEGYAPGIIAAIICVIYTNYYFTIPYRKLNFTKGGYPITFLVMLAITILTSATTSNIKKQAAIISRHDKLLMEAEKEKMRANLLRAISHDLRTPLTSIIGSSTSYLENGDRLTSAEKHDLVQHIYEDSNWLLNMVENLLSITRIHQGSGTKVTKSLEPFEEVLSEAVQRLKKRIPDARINVRFPEELVMVPMDAILIEQVIINLLENAVTHSESTRPIDCFLTTDTSSVTFHVRDYGKGIAPERLPQIFNGTGYQKGSSPDSRKGAGIGLSICKTIIDAHGGKITACSHSCGAEFSFTLPKEAADQ